MDNKDKLSRALGTAFLSHQVAQLEQNILKGSNSGHQAKNNARSGGSSRGGRGGSRGGGRGGGRGGHPRPQLGTPSRIDDNQGGNRRSDTERPLNRNSGQQITQEKIADRIVVDASVLIHALGTVRTWCRDSSKEVIIIPLEALNTLDLLKKGSSRTAIQARNASRLLEEQVGTNPRILVQQDRGYIPWEEVFAQSTGNRLSAESAKTASSVEESGVQSSSEVSEPIPPAISLGAAKRIGEPPEWLKRTVCCAKFEQQRPRDTLDGSDSSSPIKIVLAVSCAVSTGNQDSRFGERAAGSHTRQWAVNAGLQVLDVEVDKTMESKAKTPQRGPRLNRIDDSDNDISIADVRDGGNTSPDMLPWGGDVDAVDSISATTARGGVPTGIHHRKPSGEGSLLAKPRSTEPSSPRKSGHDHARGGYRGRRPSGNLVEKPSAPIALTNAGFLPAGKTIRLLTRGEKLDP
ncbi:hypothetical protein FRB90_003452 [Tulasnella sp. 427]|nr:hypothetical protein FRB90_003452 [Tulasnella sp. 427]